MKRHLLLLLLIVTGLFAQAQVYNKFAIQPQGSGAGVYRITQPVLAANGMTSVPAEHFQLWRDGQQVPIYTTVQTGVMSSSDYIEFRSELNNGKMDKPLYRNPDFQLNDKWSLQTDTAYYFLTVNPAGGNSRLVPTINDVAGNVLPVEPFFMHTAGNYFKDKINPGYAAIVGEYVYSSAYDQGEGWTSGDFGPGLSSLTTQTGLFAYTGAGGPQSRFKVNATGNAQNPRSFQVKINGTEVLNQAMDYFDYSKVDIPLDISLISSGIASVEIKNMGVVANDRMSVAQYEIVYPRQFNLGNARNFYFELPANTNGNYLEISNFNYNSVAPVLYDLTNGRRYVGDVTNPSLVKVALLPSSINRKLVLVAEDAANIMPVTSLQQRNFINYSLAANKGNFLIISHPSLTNGAGGSNPVENYRAYRSSAAGGSYTAKIYMIDQLTDQFAFGVKKHPLSIRNFIRWARTSFGMPLKSIFLIGRGVTYNQYRVLENEPRIEELALVPTFGNPASDLQLAMEPGNEIPLTPIGRLSAITPDEVAVYLDKIVEYEQAQAFNSPLIQDKAWMKNAMHVVGASDAALQAILDTYMDRYKSIIKDTAYGGNVSTFSKSSAESVQQASSVRISQLFQDGLGLITYFGHSSATTLEFNLDDPSTYNNQGKYPVFIALGCNAGGFYSYNLARFQQKTTLSEKFVLAPQRGTIAFIASTHFGIVHYLDIYNTRFYNALAKTHYGKTLGEQQLEAIAQVFNLTTQNDYYARFHCEQATIHGDPAIRINSSPKPDYVIEQPLVKVSPSFVSVADTSFALDARFLNIGKAVSDSIVVEIKRTYPDLSAQVINRTKIAGIRYIDSLLLNIPIIPTRDKGLNKITITVDADNTADELYETNNTITKDVFIYEDEARPVYPYNYSIVNTQGIKLKASTANPFSPLKQYMMEMDTTELFNSPFKVVRTVSSTGGLLEFIPGVNFTDSTVYYWRVAPVPASGQPTWNKASFVYLPNSDFGFNQSHLYQHFKSNDQRMSLDSVTRKWTYTDITNTLFIRSGVFPTSFNQAVGFSVAVNGDAYIRSVCGVSNVVFNVFDPVTFQPWFNALSGPGQYGSDNVCGIERQYNFQFNILDTNKRRKIVEFLDLIPDGHFVVVRNCSGTNPLSNTYASTWITDQSYLGTGNSMYHRLQAQGFADIDSFYMPRAFVFAYKKNRAAEFTPRSTFSAGIFDPVTFSMSMITPDSLAFMTSPVFGPAKAWRELKWRGSSEPTGDIPTVDVIGIRTDGTETTLFSNLNPGQQDFAINSISAVTYPYVKLKLRTFDKTNFTPYQLRYWRLTYDPVPEGAIAPNIFFKTKDTTEVGEPVDFEVAFKNISDVPFDSLKLKMVITDRNNVPNIVPLLRRRPLTVYGTPNDTIHIATRINTSTLSGLNTMYLEVNPDNDQPEQYHFNNFAYRSLYVKPDSLNPLLDVTFDGVHILNRDIVSSKPDIIIKLKDEAKWLILDDTSLLTVRVKFPDGTLRRYNFNTDTMRFTPAGQAPNPDNTATINLRPYLAVDGEYELIVTGKDKSENTAGNIEYRVAFQVINKPMISNMLNYPNPFTTSTAFVFTITGSEVPQNIKIEIMTVTGKIVREITKNELGPLHIGRNITEFKWDGTDQYGQKLANGIYLYRVITNLNGKTLDKYRSEGENTDKFFNKGYGKMVLMR
jgi:hypothetical protein